MDRAERVKLVESRQWWHSIEVGDGVVTPGQVPLFYLREQLARLRVPPSLAGLRVLDVGAWDGFFSFEAEKRGAARVVAYDLHPPEYFGFATAKQLLGSRVEYVQGSVYDIRPERVGTFDVVFFFGVLYHLRYPLLALDRLREVTDGYALIETHHLDRRLLLPDGTSVAPAAIDPRLADIALYQFYRNDELNPGDFSNWFALNRRAIEDGLWSAGFRPEYLADWDDRIAFRATRLPGTPEYQQQTYEGLTWRVHPDGSQEAITQLREGRPAPARETPARVPSTGDQAPRGARAALAAARGGMRALMSRLRTGDARGHPRRRP
jgi:tRNA (mo5U34)-methyltransferase